MKVGQKFNLYIQADADMMALAVSTHHVCKWQYHLVKTAYVWLPSLSQTSIANSHTYETIIDSIYP